MKLLFKILIKFIPFEALDWMLANGLIINGTVLGYDDFSYGLPERARRLRSWAKIKHLRLEGEPRAHAEIMQKWGVRFEEISRVPLYPMPHEPKRYYAMPHESATAALYHAIYRAGDGPRRAGAAVAAPLCRAG